MPGLELALVDKVLALLNVRSQQRRRLLDDVVRPAFESFEAVHQHYVASFASYRDELRATDRPLDEAHPLLRRIRDDNLDT